VAAKKADAAVEQYRERYSILEEKDAAIARLGKLLALRRRQMQEGLRIAQAAKWMLEKLDRDWSAHGGTWIVTERTELENALRSYVVSHDGHSITLVPRGASEEATATLEEEDDVVF